MVDGNRCPKWDYSSEAVVKGDSLIAEISAASIIAKVTRDKEMLVLDQQFPEYGFAKHKGYPTAFHLAKLAELGPLPQYRMSFKPVQQSLVLRNGQLAGS
jgi:ribonuclease HII